MRASMRSSIRPCSRTQRAAISRRWSFGGIWTTSSPSLSPRSVPSISVGHQRVRLRHRQGSGHPGVGPLLVWHSSLEWRGSFPRVSRRRKPLKQVASAEAAKPVVPATPSPEPKTVPKPSLPEPAKPLVTAIPKPVQMPLPVIPDTEVTRKLKEWEDGFVASTDRDVIKVRTDAIYDLDAKMLAAIDRAMAAPGTSSEDKASIYSERKHRLTHDLMPEIDASNVSPGLHKLRDTYRSALAIIDDTARKTAVALHSKYEQALAAYLAELTASGKASPEELAMVSRKQKQIAASRSAIIASAGGASVETLRDAGKDGLVLTGDKKFITSESFTPPVEITVVAKTDDKNLRLGYAADQLIFNWEMNDSELRVDGGPTGGKHRPGAGRIAKDTFVTVRWEVLPFVQRVFVDDEMRLETVRRLRACSQTRLGLRYEIHRDCAVGQSEATQQRDRKARYVEARQALDRRYFRGSTGQRGQDLRRLHQR